MNTTDMGSDYSLKEITNNNNSNNVSNNEMQLFYGQSWETSLSK